MSNRHGLNHKAAGILLMAWQGGQCPNCKEEMPRGVLVCRYCRSPLEVNVEEFPASLKPELSGQTASAANTDRPSAVEQTTTKKPRKLQDEPPGRRPTRITEDSKETVESGRVDSTRRTEPRSFRLALNDTRISTIVTVVVVLLLLAPLCVSGPVPGESTPVSLTTPMIHSGDEPHQLVLINSVVRDGDLDVANNYASVHAGGQEAGRKFAGSPLDHHVVWYIHHRFTRWWELYETDESLWSRNSDGQRVPVRRKNFQKLSVPAQEYSRHSPGLALLLAPILFPFRNSALLEPAALVCSSVLTVIGYLALCRILRPYTATSTQAVLIGAVAYLGSPLWHYGRTLHVEPFAATLLLCGYASVLRSYRYLVGGLCVGAAVLVKAEFLLVATPLLLEPVWRRDRVDAACVGLPVFAAIAIRMFWNQTQRGGWTHTSSMWEWDNPMSGLAGLMFSTSPCHGILLVCPALFLCIACLQPWWAQHRRDAILISAGIAAYGLFAAWQLEWWGGTCYSARLLVPILPLLFVPMAMIVQTRLWSDRGLGLVFFVVTAVISIFFGTVAAFACENVYGKHPLMIFF